MIIVQKKIKKNKNIIYYTDQKKIRQNAVMIEVNNGRLKLEKVYLYYLN